MEASLPRDLETSLPLARPSVNSRPGRQQVSPLAHRGHTCQAGMHLPLARLLLAGLQLSLTVTVSNMLRPPHLGERYPRHCAYSAHPVRAVPTAQTLLSSGCMRLPAPRGPRPQSEAAHHIALHAHSPP